MRIVGDKKGQITIFIIIAVIILGLVATYFVVRGGVRLGGLPARLEPVEEQYLNCIEEYSIAGASLLGEGGGYIYLPEFVQGSGYMPTSNYLDFFGTPVPFWYYVSGNNLVAEQVPSKSDMEEQLERYLEENLVCDFSEFTVQGFEIDLEEARADVSISENKINVRITSNLDIVFEDESARVSRHDKEIDSRIGKFYTEAKNIYNYEMRENFLEKYSLDVLYLYAPVTGIELSCSPKTWIFQDVENDVKEALEANILMLKTRGNYYTIQDERRNYFVVDVRSDNAVQFLYSRDWPTRIDVQDEDGVLIAEPVGNQPGLGALGFCYVPYHFVYDMVYPVLIQIYDEKEIFQFPVNVVIEGNKEREALPGTFVGESEPEVCKYKNTQMNVYTYDTYLNPVEANIQFKCFNEVCDIGKTEISGGNAMLTEDFPQCVNGFVIASAGNYEEKKEMVSTNQGGTVNIILDRLYDISIDLKLDGESVEDLALVYFSSEDTIATLVWPEQKSVKLSDGLYNVSAYVYREESMTIPGVSTEKCVDVPDPGLLGIFGKTTEQCFDLEIPDQEVTGMMIGGGKSELYVTETELERGRAEIQVEALPVPESAEDLQDNYNLIETKMLYMNF